MKETIELDGSSSSRAEYVIVGVRRSGSRSIFNGANTRRIIRQKKNTKLSVYGIEFRNGNATSDGGGAILSAGGGNLVVVGCRFISNVAASSRNLAIEGGGGVKVGGGSARFYYCDFIDNKGNTGGGVGGTSANLQFFNCDFTRNEAIGGSDRTYVQGDGAGIRSDRAQFKTGKAVKIINCVFTNNKAMASVRDPLGVVVVVYNVPDHLDKSGLLVEMLGSKFVRNDQSDVLGVVGFHGWGNVVVSGTQFLQNRAEKGIFWLNLKEGNTAAFNRVSFDRNTGDPFRRGPEDLKLTKVFVNGKALKE